MFSGFSYEMHAPLILTLKIDNESHKFFDDLRRAYFPPERNFLAAHITLFHNLPGEELNEIRQATASICEKTEIFPLRFTRWRFLGKGSAMTIESEELLKLRAHFAELWRADLAPQDRQKFQPHITVQNKVASDEARRTFENLSADWQVKLGTAEGLTLWNYIAPRWELADEFLFAE